MEDKRLFMFNILPKNSVCAEVGVWKGEFSQEIINKLDPISLFLIDPWRFESSYPDALYGGSQVKNQQGMDETYESVKKRYNKNYRIKILRMDSIKASKCFSDEFFDWVYLDANHSYEFIKQDLELWFPKIKNRGVLYGDDFDVIGWWNNGVTKAVDEFVNENNLNLEIKNNQFIIRKEI